MSLIVYLDEAGDHSLESIDRDFPVFVMVMFICDENTYINQIVPAVYKLKMDFCGHEGAILHSRDIRKAQGDFAYLADRGKREEFYKRLNKIMNDHDYQLISVAIDKVKHKKKYAYPENPYDLSLTFALERLLPLLDEKGQTEVYIIAEARSLSDFCPHHVKIAAH